MYALGLLHNLNATDNKVDESVTDSAHYNERSISVQHDPLYESHKRIIIDNSSEHFAKKSKLNTHDPFNTSNDDISVNNSSFDHEKISDKAAPTISFTDLPVPAIELIIIFGDKETHLTNRQFFKVATGYDSTNLDSIKRTGWPTEFKWSNIIHHYSRYKINFHGNNSNADSLAKFLNKIDQTPTFILSSMIYSIRAMGSKYWDYLKHTNIKSFDLALNCIDCDDSFGLELGNMLASSHVDSLRIARQLLNEKNLLTVLQSLKTSQLKTLNIEHNNFSRDVIADIFHQVCRLNVIHLDVSCILLPSGTSNQLFKILTSSNVTQLITSGIECQSQAEAHEFFQTISQSKITRLSLNNFNFKSIQDFKPLFENLKLIDLDLSRCALDTFQFVDIVKALAGKPLIDLNLSWNEITSRNIEQLGQLLLKTTIRSINLTHNSVRENDANQYLVARNPQISWKFT